ncbi:S ribonuclease [Pyrus ussuriensis x Pyrus communis]|uniref:S ribonuclease n=1 Tax=Pyrus ussuriensis x Pyrus communis TaxID=2448454 RepID=A0A5N5FXI5_9ROSA|nr:S ribonuclease [Pyrus ussuriensis x Pyrus communis]
MNCDLSQSGRPGIPSPTTEIKCSGLYNPPIVVTFSFYFAFSPSLPRVNSDKAIFGKSRSCTVETYILLLLEARLFPGLLSTGVTSGNVPHGFRALVVCASYEGKSALNA